MAALAGMLDRAISGSGCVVGVVGPAGIGKSRIVAETAAVAASRGVRVFSTFCESHASEIPFHVVARLLRAAFGVDELDDDEAARAQVRVQVAGRRARGSAAAGRSARHPRVHGIAARHRRRCAPAAADSAGQRRLAGPRQRRRVYVIEDVHWIDEVSESMLADFLAVVPQTHSLVLITYRPEYHGALSRTPGAQTIALAPAE